MDHAGKRVLWRKNSNREMVELKLKNVSQSKKFWANLITDKEVSGVLVASKATVAASEYTPKVAAIKKRLRADLRCGNSSSGSSVEWLRERYTAAVTGIMTAATIHTT